MSFGVILILFDEIPKPVLVEQAPFRTVNIPASKPRSDNPRQEFKGSGFPIGAVLMPGSIRVASWFMATLAFPLLQEGMLASAAVRANT